MEHVIINKSINPRPMTKGDCRPVRCKTCLLLKTLCAKCDRNEQ